MGTDETDDWPVSMVVTGSGGLSAGRSQVNGVGAVVEPPADPKDALELLKDVWELFGDNAVEWAISNADLVEIVWGWLKALMRTVVELVEEVERRMEVQRAIMIAAMNPAVAKVMNKA